MTTNADHLASLFAEQNFENTQSRYPVTATIVQHDGQTASVTVPSFDGGVHVFGGIDYETSQPLSAGSTVLVVADENGDYWVIAP